MKRTKKKIQLNDNFKGKQNDYLYFFLAIFISVLKKKRVNNKQSKRRRTTVICYIYSPISNKPLCVVSNITFAAKVNNKRKRIKETSGYMI